MTEADIDAAIEKLLASKELKEKLNISKSKAYDLRNRNPLSVKLEALYQAGKLKLIE